MALRIDEIPDDIAKLHDALAVMLGKHSELRRQFAVAMCAGDDAALQTIRARLEAADGEIEAAYSPFRAALVRFGSEICAAVQFLQAEEQTAENPKDQK
jgi:hypothetical protein